MRELGLVAELIAQVGEHLGDSVEVGLVVEGAASVGVEGWAGVGGAGTLLGRDEAAPTVGAELAADVDPAVFEVAADVLLELIEGIAGGVGVDGDGGAARATEQAVDGQAGLFAEDV